MKRYYNLEEAPVTHEDFMRILENAPEYPEGFFDFYPPKIRISLWRRIIGWLFGTIE